MFWGYLLFLEVRDPLLRGKVILLETQGKKDIATKPPL
jgi:hypothetical protein